MSIAQKFRTVGYFISHGWTGYYLLQKLAFRGMISKEKFTSSRAAQRFYHYFENLPHEEYEKELRHQFDTVLHQYPDRYTDHPQTFNEKIQWLKVHDTTPLKTRLADKYLVREWIAEQIGEEYLIPLVGGPWKSPEEIDFDQLPDRFALKANHGSGMNLIVKDKSKLNLPEVRSLCNSWLQTCYGCIGLEAQYFDIPRVLIAEEYMEEQASGGLTDYKIHCLGGKPRIIQMIGDRDFKNHIAHEVFLDSQWRRIHVAGHTYADFEGDPVPPVHLQEMLDVATRLSRDFKYVRVDLYEARDRVFFGEMTFTPIGGFGKWGKQDGLSADEIIIP